MLLIIIYYSNSDLEGATRTLYILTEDVTYNLLMEDVIAIISYSEWSSPALLHANAIVLFRGPNFRGFKTITAKIGWTP